MTTQRRPMPVHVLRKAAEEPDPLFETPVLVEQPASVAVGGRIGQVGSSENVDVEAVAVEQLPQYLAVAP